MKSTPVPDQAEINTGWRRCKLRAKNTTIIIIAQLFLADKVTGERWDKTWIYDRKTIR
jgi:hypothetical protein